MTGLRLLPALAYATWILRAGVSVPGPDVPGINDKLAHLIGFFVLSVLLIPASRVFFEARARRQRTALVVGGSLLVGGLLELWQSFLPYRSAELLDLLADALGAALGGGVLWLAAGRGTRELAAESSR